MVYDVQRPPNPRLAERVRWNGDPQSHRDWPTLAEVIEAARKEFPGALDDQLIITDAGWHDAVLELRRKSS